MDITKAKSKFLLDRGTYCAHESLQYYDCNVTNFINWLSDNGYDGDMSDLPDDILEQYVLYLRSRKDKHGRPVLTNTSVRTYIRAVRVYLNYCQAKGYCKLELSVKLPRSDNDIVIPLSSIEVKQIESKFDLSDPLHVRNYCCLHLMLDAGLRLSEVTDLTAQCMDLDGHVLYVKNAKYNKNRIIPLYGDYVTCLSQFKCNPGHVMGLTVSGLQSVIKRLSIISGVTRLHPHLCRHTFATSYLIGGGNLERLRLMLGHADYSTTMMYVHLSEQYNLTHYDIYRLHPDFFQTGYDHVI